MRLLFCINRDMHSFRFLQALASQFDFSGSAVFFTDGVGKPTPTHPHADTLRWLERDWPNQLEAEAAHQGQSCYFRALAERLTLRMRHVGALRADALTEAIAAEAPDLIVSVRFGKIFKNAMIALPRLGVINLHSGLLPEYRGILATFWARLHQQPQYGYTLHRITDEGIDTGDCLHRQPFDFTPEMSLWAAINSLYPQAASVMAKQLQALATGQTLPAQPQTGTASYYGTPSQADWEAFHRLSARIVHPTDPLPAMASLSVPL